MNLLSGLKTILTLSKNAVLHEPTNKPRYISGAQFLKSLGREYTTAATDSKRFNQWLGGLMDGDGYFGFYRGKYVQCSIVAHEDECAYLLEIQTLFGGSIGRPYTDSAGRAKHGVAWSLTGKEKVAAVVRAVNGNTLLPLKYARFQLVCNELQISPILGIITKDSAWLAGLFDSDGHVEIARADGKARICITQKDGTGLEQIASIWGGAVHYNSTTGIGLWRLGNSFDLPGLTEYLLLHSRNQSKRTHLETLRSLLALRSTAHVDRQAVTQLVAAFWAEKDSKR